MTEPTDDSENPEDGVEHFLASEDVAIEDGQVAYECSSWAGESRGLLGSLLVSAEIHHVWQGTTVTVHEADEDRVDALIDDVLASARPALDPAAPKLVFQVASWPVALQTELVDELTAAQIPYEWDVQGDLIVRESDEDEVEAVLELLPDPEDESELQPGEVSSDDGVAVHELLDRIFMSASRLTKRPTDAAATVDIVQAASLLGHLAVPFGFEPPQWQRLVVAARELSQALEPSTGSADSRTADSRTADSRTAAPVTDAPVTDEQVSELAQVLTQQVRLYV
ncbi:MAG: hypothetical protein WD029_03330 [Microthrixaceae bacterium]